MSRAASGGICGRFLVGRLRGGTADPSTTRPPAAKDAAEKPRGRFAQDDNREGNGAAIGVLRLRVRPPQRRGGKTQADASLRMTTRKKSDEVVEVLRLRSRMAPLAHAPTSLRMTRRFS